MSIIYFRKSPNEAWATIPAIKGDDGYTPIKGVDYFTEEEVEAIKAELEAALDEKLGVIENGTY